MKIRVVVTAEPEKRKIATAEGDVAEDGDLTCIVSEAIAEARKQGLQSWGWSLSVEKAD